MYRLIKIQNTDKDGQDLMLGSICTCEGNPRASKWRVEDDVEVWKKKKNGQRKAIDIILRTGIGEYWYCCGIYSDGAGHGYITGANVWCPVAAWGPGHGI